MDYSAVATATDASSTEGRSGGTYLGLACMHAGSAVYAIPSAHELAVCDGKDSAPSKVGWHYQHSEHSSGHLTYGLAVLRSKRRAVGVGKRNNNNRGTRTPAPAAAAEAMDAEARMEERRRDVHDFVAVSCSFYDDLIQIWSV